MWITWLRGRGGGGIQEDARHAAMLAVLAGGLLDGDRRAGPRRRRPGGGPAGDHPAGRGRAEARTDTAYAVWFYDPAAPFVLLPQNGGKLIITDAWGETIAYSVRGW